MSTVYGSAALAIAHDEPATKLFTVDEARAFDKLQLYDAAKYPEHVILDVEERIRLAFELACGVAFVPSSSTATLDGTDTATLLVPAVKLTAVTAASMTDTAGTVTTLDATDLADIAVYSTGKLVRRTRGVWTLGYQNVSVTYSHGHVTVPPQIKRAALIAAVYDLVPSDLPWGTSAYTEGGINWTLTIDPARGRYFGLNEIDGVLGMYDETRPAIG